MVCAHKAAAITATCIKKRLSAPIYYVNNVNSTFYRKIALPMAVQGLYLFSMGNINIGRPKS